jgi:hypothetical protein
VVLNNGVNTMRTCGVLLVHYDDKAVGLSKSETVGIHAGRS